MISLYAKDIEIQERLGLTEKQWHKVLACFHNEPAFIPNRNLPFEALLRTPSLRRTLNLLGQNIPAGTTEGDIPRADMLRFEIGHDRFFFFRPLTVRHRAYFAHGRYQTLLTTLQAA